MIDKRVLAGLNRSLAARLIGLLTVALFPIGLIAVYQTVIVIKEADSLSQRDILARTSEAASAELALIQRAFGVADALGASVRELGFATAACNRAVEEFARRDDTFVFVGVLQADGMMECSNTGQPIDFSTFDDWISFEADPRRTITVNRDGAASGQSVLIVSVPIYDEDAALQGAVSLSIPHSLADTLLQSDIDGVEVALVDAEGAVLSTSVGMDQADRFAALDIAPETLDVMAQGRTVERTLADGVKANIAVVELIEDDLFVLGKWTAEAQPSAVSLFGTAAPVFPIIMWLASLIVAFMAVQRLVLQYLTRLRRTMQRFSLEDKENSFVHLIDAPQEFNEIAASYNSMVDRVLAEHAANEASLKEKDTLLKEVHHRVKNNLQLIASIINMQLRTIEAPEAERVLRRVQDRVMSLATIHKSLYTDTQVDVVRADGLLREITNGVLNVGVSRPSELKTDIVLSKVELDPDQAVPLSLLVTEAVTNGIKYAGAPDGEAASLHVSLSETADGLVRITVANSRGPAPLTAPDERDGTGLGSRLISAFASQLGGTLDIEETETRYTMAVEFAKLGAQAEATQQAAE